MLPSVSAIILTTSGISETHCQHTFISFEACYTYKPGMSGRYSLKYQALHRWTEESLKSNTM